MSGENRQWILARRPVGDIRDGDLLFQSSAVPRAGDGDLVIRIRYLSLDPANRVWMCEADQYMPPVELNTPMRGVVCGEVVESRATGFSSGDLVMGLGTWGDYCRVSAASMIKVPVIPGIDQLDVFAHLYVVAPTAYFGLVDIGTPKIGETLVVSGAAGGVGSITGQLGKALGCRVVGIAGGKDKCAWLTDELGFDAAVDYKAGSLEEQLKSACPDGVDIFFDNVGGQTLDTVLGMSNLFARIIMCGLISTYNSDCKTDGPSHFPRILMKRMKVQGFLIFDFIQRYPEAFRALATLHAEGKLKWRTHRVDGLENAVDAVRLLYHGGNNGKLLVVL